ncbi:MAG: D-alanine--D-alanine ligase, partial [Patescibacteria group bacterium]
MTYQPTIINKKLNIGVFFGSRSLEHDVSIITAQMIIDVLKKSDKYNAIPVYLDKKGSWFISSSLGDVKFFRRPEFEKELDKIGDFLLDLDASKGFLKFQPKRKKLFSRSNIIIIDVAFPAFHGSFGEDGTIQGLFEILNIPYVGCGVLASALVMNKIVSRKILEKEGFLIVNNLWFCKNEFERRKKEEIFKEIEQKLSYPLFVKPNRLGSSIGISKVNNQKELDFAIEVVFQFDEKVIIEEAVQNLMEVNCAVIGNDDLVVSLPEQPSYKQEFQTFEEKYLTKGGTIKKGAKKNIIPA